MNWTARECRSILASAHKVKLSVSRRAARDIQNIRRFTWARWGPDQAAAYYLAIREAMALLCDHPHLGQERDAVFPGVRSYRVASHSIFYLVTDEERVVLRLLRHRMEVDPEQLT